MSDLADVDVLVVDGKRFYLNDVDIAWDKDHAQLTAIGGEDMAVDETVTVEITGEVLSEERGSDE